MNGEIEAITLITYVLFTYLILALLVERIVEILVAVFNYVELHRGWDEYWNQTAEKLSRRYTRLYGYAGDERGTVRSVLDGLLWNIITEESNKGGRRIISTHMIRLNYLRLGTRIVAFLIAAVLVLSLQLDFVKVISAMFSGAYQPVVLLRLSPVVSFILTTAALSIGAEPLHHVIRGIEKFAEKKRNAPEGQAS